MGTVGSSKEEEEVGISHTVQKSYLKACTVIRCISVRHNWQLLTD